MSLAILTPPAVEPVSLAEAKLHLRVTADAEDALIARLITAARQQVEALCGLALITTAFRQTFEGPAPNPPDLARGPVQSVDHVSDDRRSIDFTAGFGGDASAVPAGLKQAVLALVAFGFDHRGEEGPGSTAPAEPWLAPWLRVRL